MSLKHAILGFLSIEPSSGYDLKKSFDQSVRHFWPANLSQIYRTLAGLNEEGLAGMEVVEREDRLDMKVYHITEAGRKELHHWLSTPLPPQDVREPFLIQLYFGGMLSDDEIATLLLQEISTLEHRLSAYDSMYATYREKLRAKKEPRSYFMNVLTLECGIATDRASLEWLKGVLARVRSGEYRLADFKTA